MRPWESRLMYAGMAGLCLDVLPTSILPPEWVAVSVLSVLFMAHVLLECPRVQLLPLYAVLIWTCYQQLSLVDQDVEEVRNSALARWARMIALEIVLTVTAAIACIVPVPTQSLARIAKHGPYRASLGVTELVLHAHDASGSPRNSRGSAANTNNDSSDTAAAASAELRLPLRVKVVYPAAAVKDQPRNGACASITPRRHRAACSTCADDDADHKPTAPGTRRHRGALARYMSRREAAGFANFIKMPGWVFRHLSLAQVPLAHDAVLCQDRDSWPVVIFSHGLGGMPSVYSAALIELASHGFIVVAPTHNDGSAAISHTRGGHTVHHRRLNDLPAEEAVRIRKAQLKQRVSEIRFVIDCLHSPVKSMWDPMVPATAQFRDGNVLDLSRLSIFGHSFGGATAVNTSFMEPDRVRACVVHDVWMEPVPPEVSEKGLSQPLLSVLSEKWIKWSEQHTLHQTLFKNSNHNDTRCFAVPKSMHSNFSDVPLLSKVLAKRLKEIGTIDPMRFFDIVFGSSILFLWDQLGLVGDSGLVDDVTKAKLVTQCGPKSGEILDIQKPV